MAAGCTPERDPTELFADAGAGQVVVESTLIVGQLLPPIRLSRTVPPGEPYDWQDAAVDGATVVVILQGHSAIPYTQYGFGLPGVYLPPDYPEYIVRPGETYELFVETDSGEFLHAVTTTPQPLQVESWVLLDPAGVTELRTLQTFAQAGDSVYAAPENQLRYAEGLLETRLSLSTTAASGAVGFQLAIFSLDLDSDYVIDPPFFDDEDFESLDRVGSSPAVTATSGRVRLPWFSIYYQGRHLYKVFAVDANWFDYIRSVPEADVGLGFGGNAGDGFASPIFHVEGGIGLFGSAAVDSVGFTILPAD